ncbi:MAG: hypothetical protein H7338_06730 [Candidatus Sericytochromatia bacterium]|nr:hypothetical protein [Candidatus Sericytochromatia bacterium]
MRNLTWPAGLSGSVACLVLLSATACGVPTTQTPLRTQPSQPIISQQPMGQQPYVQPVQPPARPSTPNIYSGQRFGQSRALVDEAAKAAREGRTNDAVTFLEQAKTSFASDVRQFSATDPNITAMREKLDNALSAIRSSTDNGREVASIFTEQLKDAFQEIVRRMDSSQSGQTGATGATGQTGRSGQNVSP